MARLGNPVSQCMGARRRRINKELVGGAPTAPADEESGPSKYARRTRAADRSKSDAPPFIVTLAWTLVVAVVVFALGRLAFA